MPIVGINLAVSVVLILLVLIVHIWKNVPIGVLTRDLPALADMPLYSGFLSQVGMLFWAATVSICFFTATILFACPERDHLNLKLFLFVSGILTLLLCLDDVFQLHEGLFPYFGIHEKAVLLGYSLLLVCYLVRLYAVVLKTEYILLVMSIIFFGGSVGLDVLNLSGIHPYLFEDSAKLVGIVSWLSYFSRVGLRSVFRCVVP